MLSGAGVTVRATHAEDEKPRNPLESLTSVDSFSFLQLHGRMGQELSLGLTQYDVEEVIEYSGGVCESSP